MRAFRATSLLFALALAAVAILAAPSPALAQCFCVPGGGTPNYVGTGSTCTAANDSVFSQCDAYATNFCEIYYAGVCHESSVIVTQQCSQSGGTWSETGHIAFKCWDCA